MAIGIDLVQVARMEAWLGEEKKLGRILRPKELDRLLTYGPKARQAQHLAGLYAAKEAALKALGRGLFALSFQDIEVRSDSFGAPQLLLYNKARRRLQELGGDQMDLSISHDGGMAMAMASIRQSGFPGRDLALEDFSLNSELDQSLLHRDRKGYKSQYGRLAIVAGSRGMLGACCLAARAALRSGAGLVYALVPSSLADLAQIKLDEVIVLPMEDEGKGHFSEASLPQLLETLTKMDALVLGPGLGRGRDQSALVKKLVLALKDLAIPAVLDADGLNALADFPEVLDHVSSPVVVTPHQMEMARLLHTSVEAIGEDRMGAANRFAARHRVLVLLKGADTIISNGEIHYINPTGNPGMATAGAGDVLSGMLGAFLAYGYAPMVAVRTACYLHGLSGDIVAYQEGEDALIASDLIAALPAAFQLARREAEASLGKGE